MGLPPSEPGTMVKRIVPLILPGTAITLAGTSGTVAGVTALERDDGRLGPTALVAVTANRYGVPFLKLPTTCDSEVEPGLLSEPPAGTELTV